MPPSREELQHLLVPRQGVGGLGTIQHECRVEEALDESDVAFFFEEVCHFLATNDVTEDGRGNLYERRKKIVYGILVDLLYSRKIWWGIKFGGLAVYITTAKLKNLPKFPTRIYTYSDPVPNRQI